MAEKSLLSIRDVSNATSMSDYTVRQAIDKKELKAVRNGSRIYVRPADLETWIDAMAKVGE